MLRIISSGNFPPPMPTYQPCATLLKIIEPCAPPTNVVFRPATPCASTPQTKVVRRPCFRRMACACAGASYSGGVRRSATPCQDVCHISGLIKTGATSGAFAAASASVNGQSTVVTN